MFEQECGALDDTPPFKSNILDTNVAAHFVGRHRLDVFGLAPHHIV